VLEAKLADMPSKGRSNLKTIEGLIDIVIKKYSDIGFDA